MKTSENYCFFKKELIKAAVFFWGWVKWTSLSGSDGLRFLLAFVFYF